jgi:hypothetical protein
VNALEKLQKWNRKYYKFTIGTGGNYQPGDGLYIKLENSLRSVVVCDTDFSDWPDKQVSIEQLIEEALKQWHADTQLKRFEAYFIWLGSITNVEEIDIQMVSYASTLNYYKATLKARTEDEVWEKLEKCLEQNKGWVLEKAAIYERQLAEPIICNACRDGTCINTLHR